MTIEKIREGKKIVFEKKTETAEMQQKNSYPVR